MLNMLLIIHSNQHRDQGASDLTALNSQAGSKTWEQAKDCYTEMVKSRWVSIATLGESEVWVDLMYLNVFARAKLRFKTTPRL